jgi:hypothetical protein
VLVGDRFEPVEIDFSKLNKLQCSTLALVVYLVA